MGIEIRETCDVQKRVRHLGLQSPGDLSILPRNIGTAASYDELVHESSVTTVRSLFRQEGIQETRIEPDGKDIPCIQENEFSLLLPTLFVGSLILSGNTHLLDLALNVISSYATDFFKGIPGRKKVVLKVVVEQKGKSTCREVHYEGDPEGLKSV